MKLMTRAIEPDAGEPEPRWKRWGKTVLGWLMWAAILGLAIWIMTIITP